ncbi:hypothetical protein [Gluconobacter wancherniae]|uniref:hypothetical protein n=1 Tax=Gluconobacter wancherniae TaxID=1307955 RepID=UPI001B8B2B8F|nr:hypothetical protein [Gluconobacter wancherniae]
MAPPVVVAVDGRVKTGDPGSGLVGTICSGTAPNAAVAGLIMPRVSSVRTGKALTFQDA